LGYLLDELYGLGHSEEQLSSFLDATKADAVLHERIKGPDDLDAAISMAKEAGFDVSKSDWLRHQASQVLELGDEELKDGISEAFGAGLFMTCHRSHHHTHCSNLTC
jgi:predicted ribosomally synthesized peptide with nif11-like leader